MTDLPATETQPPVLDEHRTDTGQNLVQLKRLAEYLDDCRQRRKTVTYLEAANAISIEAPHRIHRLTELLETLMEYDHKHYQPLRAALVVSRTGVRLPADGFFLKAQSLGLSSAGIFEQFHQQCLYRLFDDPATGD